VSHESKDTRLRVHGVREALNRDIKVSPAASVARVAAGRNAPSWRLDGNILFQKPLSADRDAVDPIKNGFVALSIERRASPECEL